MKFINPTIEWYKSISIKYQLTPRCPFANIYKCPKYYDSLYLLEGTGAISISEKDIDELNRYWDERKLKFGITEEAPGIVQKNDKFSLLTNFCPEVTYHRFGYFASCLSEFADEIDKDIRHTELQKRNIDTDDWRWYFETLRPLHYADCSYYSILKKNPINQHIDNENETELTDSKKEDYDKYGYKCKDQIHIPGTRPIRRSNEIFVNKIKIKIGDSLFLLLLRLIVELKRGQGGWINRLTLYSERIINDPDKFQIYSNLRSALQGSLINKGKEPFIENDGSKNYRVSTHPDFITYNKEKLLSHNDADIRKLAKQLP